MRCLGTVLFAILGCGAFLGALVAAVFALIWFSEQSATYFGLYGAWPAAFMFGYFVIGTGMVIGITTCRESL
jgi:hypothetical protein